MFLSFFVSLQVMQVEGLTLECHAVHGNFLRGNPTNVAVVFHAAKDQLALSHNAGELRDVGCDKVEK